MSNEITKRAIELANSAIEHDKNKEYEEALKLYTDAVACMLKGMKYESDQVNEVLREKTRAYVKRAEKLKEMLHGKPKKKAVAHGGGGGRSKSEGSDSEDDSDADADPEQAALRRAIEAAVVMESPDVAWSDVAGLEGAKEALQEAVILPMRLPHMFHGKREPWHGILMYGPPGTGKSYLAKAVATQVAMPVPGRDDEPEDKSDGEEEEDGEEKKKKKKSCSFISVSSSTLVSKWQGQSERLVKELFELARENAKESPCVVFIDEIDSLLSARSDNESESSRRIKTEFLVQMQGVGNANGRVLVVGATNIPWQLDSAARRRFEKRIYIPLPDIEARRTIFELNLKGMRHTLQPQDFHILAEKADGYSGSDIANAVREAIMRPVRKVQHATAFTHCDSQGVPTRGGKYLTPVSPNFRGGEVIRNDWMSLDPKKLIEPAIDMNDMESALLSAKKSVSPDDLKELDDFTREFGQSAV